MISWIPSLGVSGEPPLGTELAAKWAMPAKLVRRIVIERATVHTLELKLVLRRCLECLGTQRPGAFLHRAALNCTRVANGI